MRVKLYLVVTEEGRAVVAKLTHEAAHSYARIYAPAKVIPMWADKIPAPEQQQPGGQQNACRPHDDGADALRQRA